MKTIEIFCNYGVLAAEKRNIYTYGAQHHTATCSDKMTVKLPEGWDVFQNQAGEVMVESPWGWTYDINEVLSDLNGNPVFRALDDHGRKTTYYLYTAEQLAEKEKKEARKKEREMKRRKTVEEETTR